MTARLWRGRVGNTIVRITARAGVAQPVAGLGAGEAGADRVAPGSAGRGPLAGRGTVAQAGAVGRDLEVGANLIRSAVAPTRVGGEAAGVCSVYHLPIARQGRSRARRSLARRVRRSAATTPGGRAARQAQPRAMVHVASGVRRVEVIVKWWLAEQ